MELSKMLILICYGVWILLSEYCIGSYSSEVSSSGHTCYARSVNDQTFDYVHEEYKDIYPKRRYFMQNEQHYCSNYSGDDVTKTRNFVSGVVYCEALRREWDLFQREQAMGCQLSNIMAAFLPSDVGDGPLVVFKMDDGIFDGVFNYLPSFWPIVLVQTATAIEKDTPMQTPPALLFLLGEDALAQMDTLLPELTPSTLWNPHGVIVMVLATADPKTKRSLELQLGERGATRVAAFAWNSSSGEFDALRMKLRSPQPDDRGVVMLTCPPELEGDHDKSDFRPHYPSQYLGQLLAQWLPGLRGAPCRPYFAAPMGVRLRNGSFTGHAGALARGRLRLLAAVSLPVAEYSAALRFLLPVQKDDFCGVAPAARPKAFLDSVGGAFEASVWAVTAAALLAFAALQTLASREGSLAGSALSALFAAFVAVLTGAFPAGARLPGAWLVLSAAGLVLVNAFTGCLTSQLTAPGTAKQVDSLEELDAASQRLHIYPEYEQLFADAEPGDVVARLSRKLVSTPSRSEAWQLALEGVARGERRALLMEKSHFVMLTLLPQFNAHGRPLLHMTQRCLLTDAYKSIAVPRGSPLERSVDLLQLRALQAGLYLKWERDALGNYLSARGAALQGAAAREPYALALRHLQAAFVALGWALLAAAVACAVELGLGRLPRERSP